jgi:hypothetical protein
MEYNRNVEIQKTLEVFDESKIDSLVFPSATFDEQIKEEEEQIFKDVIDENEDIAHKNFIADNSRDIDLGESEDEDEELINEMLDYEFNEVNDDVEKIVLKDVIIILNPQDVVVKKKRNYTEAHRRAQQKYREKYPDKYRELQRKVYNNLKQDEEWKKTYNEKSKVTQKKYRDKKKEEKINNGLDVKPRGRPRKESIIKNPDGENNIIV